VVRLRTAADEGFKVTNATAVLRTMSLIAEQRFRQRLHPAEQVAGRWARSFAAQCCRHLRAHLARRAGGWTTIYGFMIGVAWK
jgi:hypothetical protein